jgi:hypothetical protein
VFGTVVAGCAILGMTYAFPFDRILEDVRTHFPGATLPGPEEPTGNGQHGMRDPMATEGRRDVWIYSGRRNGLERKASSLWASQPSSTLCATGSASGWTKIPARHGL